MKLIKTIKLHTKLRIKQEVLFYRVVKWSQVVNSLYGECPYLNEYKAVNKAVSKIQNKLPGIFFFVSDVFGGASNIKRKSNRIIDEIKY